MDAINSIYKPEQNRPGTVSDRPKGPAEVAFASTSGSPPICEIRWGGGVH